MQHTTDYQMLLFLELVLYQSQSELQEFVRCQEQQGWVRLSSALREGDGLTRDAQVPCAPRSAATVVLPTCLCLYTGGPQASPLTRISRGKSQLPWPWQPVTWIIKDRWGADVSLFNKSLWSQTLAASDHARRRCQEIAGSPHGQARRRSLCKHFCRWSQPSWGRQPWPWSLSLRQDSWAQMGLNKDKPAASTPGTEFRDLTRDDSLSQMSSAVSRVGCGLQTELGGTQW